MLTVACPVHRLQTATIRTGTVIGPETVEVGGADKESDAVAGTKNIAGIVFEIGADDIVFLWRLAVVAVHIHVADTILTIALSGHIYIGAWILCSSEKQTGGVLLIAEDKAADVLPAYWRLSLTGSE